MDYTDNGQIIYDVKIEESSVIILNILNVYENPLFIYLLTQT